MIGGWAAAGRMNYSVSSIHLEWSPVAEIQTRLVIEITGPCLKREQSHRESSIFFNPSNPTWMETSIYFEALALGTKMSAHHCHLVQRNDVLPNCFSWEINSTLRPSLLHSCHHGLITDFHLTPQVSAGAWRTALDATRSIQAQSHVWFLTRMPKVTCRG